MLEMEIVSDLHLHSRFSRAVSKNMTLSVMADFAREKGLDLLSASDFTHPVWMKEIESQLAEAGEGVYTLKEKEVSRSKDVLFLLSTEISSIYKQGDRLRRVHNLVFVPSFKSAKKFRNALLGRGCNLSADGRPIVGLSSRNLLELLLSIDTRSFLIPCHVWTPHFGVYGSKSGFDSLTEAFGDLAKYVYGIETGISSDPEMNWRVGELEKRSILSFSDAHSPANMGREATVFRLRNKKIIDGARQDLRFSYEDVKRAIMRDANSNFEIGYTIEFYPEEGKYHYSGHRTCKVSYSPKEIAEKGTKCPKCGREFIEGVAVRIEQLAGVERARVYGDRIDSNGVRWHCDKSDNHPSYVKLVRLEQVIGDAIGVGAKSKRVKAVYDKLINGIGSELDILLRVDFGIIEKYSDERIVEGVKMVRAGELQIIPGYDGEYGSVSIQTQKKSFGFADKQMGFDL